MKTILNYYLVISTICLLGIGAADAGNSVEFQKPAITNLTSHDITITTCAHYSLFLPKDYGVDPSRQWPIILFLHGIGESGTNIWLTAKNGPANFIKQHPDFPFIVISPQCPSGETWSDPVVLKILDEVQSKYATDTNRVYLTGLSMGGFGAWSLATAYPERFAAVAPVCGGGSVIDMILNNYCKKVRDLRGLPFWVFHGAKDPVVNISESERMIDALKKNGCHDIKVTIYPKGKHDIWSETYANPELYDWFLQHSRHTN